MSDTVYAGIVTFNPSIERLEKNIRSIKPQVGKVLIVDNRSENIDKIEALCKAEHVEILKNESNRGIANALNQMMYFSQENGADWCVTLDQDSVCPSNLISNARCIMKQENVGQIVPQILEHNTKEKPALGTKPNGERFQKVKKSITSAAITNVPIWQRLGGFDNTLFIDYVDFDYAIRLNLMGFSIIRMNDVFLDHELGESTYRRLFFVKIRVANHSAFRKYYICRNIVIYIRRYSGKIDSVSEILRLCKTVGIAVCFEDNKWEKFKSCMRGIIDGVLFKLK